jgi:hypothetical protein
MDTAVRSVLLAQSLRRLSPVQDRARVRYGAPTDATGWQTCAQVLSEPALFGRWRSDLAGWLTGRFGDAPERTTAGYVMCWYLFVPAYAGALLYHHERRVPSLRPEDLAFHLTAGRRHPDELALLNPSFVCLPDDPDAGAPEATVVPDQQALASVLRGRYVAHASRFVAAFAPTVRFGRHTLWAAATDALDISLLLTGQAGGDGEAGARDAAMVLAERFAPLTSASTVRHDHAAGWTRRRESCCFHYLLEDGRDTCQTCPRRSVRH